MQWYLVFLLGVATAQLTEKGMMSEFFKLVLPQTFYDGACVVLNVSKLICGVAASACKRNCLIRATVPTVPPRTLDFSCDLDEESTEEESEESEQEQDSKEE